MYIYMVVFACKLGDMPWTIRRTTTSTLTKPSQNPAKITQSYPKANSKLT